MEQLFFNSETPGTLFREGSMCVKPWKKIVRCCEKRERDRLLILIPYYTRQNLLTTETHLTYLTSYVTYLCTVPILTIRDKQKQFLQHAGTRIIPRESNSPIPLRQATPTAFPQSLVLPIQKALPITKISFINGFWGPPSVPALMHPAYAPCCGPGQWVS